MVETTQKQYGLVKEVHKLYCDCGKEMEQSNLALYSLPPIYVYKCSVCGKEFYSRTQYPYSIIEATEYGIVLEEQINE